MPRTLIKGQILADFMVERPEDNPLYKPIETEEELSDPWTLFTDGSSCTDGSEAGRILTNPKGAKFTYALRFRFDATNNEAKYEALIAGLRIAKKMGIKNLQANVDSRLVASQVNGSYIAKEPGMIQYLEKVKTLASNFKRANKSLGEGIKAWLDERSKDWIEEIPHVLWAHRTMIKSSEGEMPFLLTYEMKAVIPAEIGMPTLRTAEIDMVQNDKALEINLDLLEERREQAAIHEAIGRNNDASHAKDSGKLSPKWEGPYEVT
nr:reverse transcriptase domain-containing protein [Tanacetum cinerariifolium]